MEVVGYILLAALVACVLIVVIARVSKRSTNSSYLDQPANPHPGAKKDTGTSVSPSPGIVSQESGLVSLASFRSDQAVLKSAAKFRRLLLLTKNV